MLGEILPNLADAPNNLQDLLEKHEKEEGKTKNLFRDLFWKFTVIIEKKINNIFGSTIKILQIIVELLLNLLPKYLYFE